MTTPVLQFQVEHSIDEAEALLRQALKEEGFGILTEVDVASVLKQKLGIETRPHKLLGACNPQIAHAAIEADPDVAAYLPCGIAIRQGEAENQTVVTIQNPQMIDEAFASGELATIARDARERLERAVGQIGTGR